MKISGTHKSNAESVSGTYFPIGSETVMYSSFMNIDYLAWLQFIFEILFLKKEL